MSDRNSFKKKKSKVIFKLSEENRVKEVTYSDHDRTDYLTGFHRRKVARREFAQTRIAEKEKEELREQKKLAKLQRESYRDSIINGKALGENEDGDDEDVDDENENKVNTATVVEPSTQQFKNESNIITATIEPISFDDDDSNNNKNNNSDNSDDDNEDDEEEEEEETDKTKKDQQKVKKKENKFKDRKKRDQITSDKLQVFDAAKKIFVDDKGRKVMMKKEKGKLIPVVLTEAAENAMEKGWALPRQLREKQKKSWSLTEARKSRKKSRKEKK